MNIRKISAILVLAYWSCGALYAQVSESEVSKEIEFLTTYICKSPATEEAFMAIVNGLSAADLAASEYEDMTLGSGHLHWVIFGNGFRIGTKTCSAWGSVAGYKLSPVVKTKHLLIALAAAGALGVAYKKGYLSKIKNYLFSSSKKVEENNQK